MKFKQIMLITAILLSVMMFGTVSAAQDNSTDVGLTAQDNEDLKIESVDETAINDNDEVLMDNGDESLLKEEDDVELASVDLHMNVTIPDTVYGQNVIIYVYLPDDATGNITAICDGINMSGSIVDGYSQFTVSGLDAGMHTVSLNFSGDAKYNPSSANATFSIAKANSLITVNAPSEAYVSDVISINIISSVTLGNITVTIGEENMHTTIVDGKCQLNVTCNMDPGMYVITVTYWGDGNYNMSSATLNFTVIDKYSFESLQTLIDNTLSGDMLILTSDYNGTGFPITISKPIVIDGQGHTLDARGLSSIFYVSTDGVTLSNLNLVNAFNNEDGGAVYFDNIGVVTTCDFVNNTASKDGGAIYFKSSGNLTDCTFFINTASENGGAIFSSNSANVINCIFKDNAAGKDGGALHFLNNAHVISCSFVNNTVSNNGGAIFSTYQDGVRVQDSIFTNNSAILGGAIYNCICDENSVIEGEGSQIYPLKNTTINVTASNVIVGEEVFVMITLSDNVTGSVNLRVSEYSYGGNSSFSGNMTSLPISSSAFNQTVLIKDGKGNSTFIAQAAGDFRITVTYLGDANHRQASGSTIMTISKRNPHLEISPIEDVSYGSDFKIHIVNETEVIVLIDSQPYDLDTDGNVIIDTKTLSVGDHTVYVSSPESSNYNGASNSTVFNILRINLTAEVSLNANEGFVTVNASNDADGVFTLTIAGVIFSISKGESIDLTSLDSGTYHYILTYPGDAKYNPYNSQGNITLTKNIPEISINSSNVEYGQAESFTVRIPDGATSQIEFTLINEQNFTVDNKTVQADDGVALYTLPNLNVGKYTLNAQYKGDSKYYRTLASSSFYVAPKISLTPEVIIGDDGVISMELGDVSGSISVFVDGNFIASSVILIGRFQYALPTWAFSVGTHNISFGYDGNSFDENVFNYWDNQTSTYKPIQYPFIIHIKESKSASNTGNDKIFTLVLKDDKGNEMSNATGNVTFEVIDKFTQEVRVFVVEVVNGIANLDISQYKDGNYIITWSYSGDDKHSPISSSLELKITHSAARFLASDITVQYTLSKSYSVTVYGSDGRGVSGATVSFLINGKVYRSVKTNSNGVASLSISYTPGSHKLTIKSGSVSVTKKLTVSHILSISTLKVKKSAKKLVLKATLKKVNGKYLKGKKITFKFNGKKFTAKTNKKGVAKVTVNEKVLKKLKVGKKVTYQATYLKDTVKKSVKVKK